MRVKNIFKRLFRVYAHMYHSHVESIIALGAEAHLNTCFKHFMYFILEFALVERKELEPLVEICMVSLNYIFGLDTALSRTFVLHVMWN
jgi:hypothetical protein